MNDEPRASTCPSDLSKSAASALLAAATLFALALRLSGLGFMLPHLPNLDERVYLCQMHILRDGPLTIGELQNEAFYPNSIPRVCAWLTRKHEFREPARDLSEHLARASADTIALRRLVAWLSVLLVPGTYWLVRRFFDRTTSVVAAWFVAGSVMHLWYAQQARPHAVEASLALAAVIGALRVLRRGDFQAYLFAGVAAALSIATLQSGLAVLLPLAGAHALRKREQRVRSGAGLFAAFLLCFLAVRIFYPFLFEEGGGQIALKPISDSSGEFDLSGHAIRLAEFNGRGFAYVVRAFVDYDPLLLALSVVGLATLALAVRRAVQHREPLLKPVDHRRELYVVLAYALPYLAAIGSFEGTRQRFVLPLLPFAACLAAYAVVSGARALARRVSKRRLRAFVLATPLVMIVLVQSALAIEIAALRRAPDTSTQAAHWICDHLAPGADHIALLPTLELPLLRERSGLEHFAREEIRYVRPWPFYQLRLDDDERVGVAFDLFDMPLWGAGLRGKIHRDPDAYVCDLDLDYAILLIGGADPSATYDRLSEAVRARGRLVARFSPWRAGQAERAPILYYLDTEFADEAHLLWRALAMRCLGGTVEIYSMR